ncbi:MAG: YtxH domain-containing protein [Pisciglobus halotolerans]|nr:YtxH domain-containing protein [Pisciglobus halotolerans]
MSKNQFGKTLIVGLVSAATAMLLAPKSGRELRQDILDKGMQMKDKAKEKMDDFSDEVKQSYQEVENEMATKDIDLKETVNDITTDLNMDQTADKTLAATPETGQPPIGTGVPTADPSLPQVKPDVSPTKDNRLVDTDTLPASPDDIK